VQFYKLNSAKKVNNQLHKFIKMQPHYPNLLTC